MKITRLQELLRQRQLPQENNPVIIMLQLIQAAQHSLQI